MTDDNKSKTNRKTLYDRARESARKEGVRGISRKSRQWFRDTIEKSGKRITPSRALQMHELQKPPKKDNDARPVLGHMYFYMYDPKLKEKLPYYDTFPLTIVIKHYRDGFLGLNLHYLPPGARGMFLSKLMEIATDTKLNDRTRLRVTYNFLNTTPRYREFKPCVHRYLYSHIRSPLSRVVAEDWMMAIFLPVARFKKARSARIWSDSLS